jgi:hypothetical protein
MIMADDPNVSSPTSGDDYESKALDIMNDESQAEEKVEEEPTEEEEATSDETPGEPDTGESEPIPEEEEGEEEEVPKEEELEPEPEPKDEQLTLSGKEAYEKLKKDHPDALKNNPALRQVFFREKAFSDIYPSVDAARVAAHDSEFLNGLSDALNKGELKPVISSLSDKAKENLAENFIATLHDVDPRGLFVRATAPFIANILHGAHDYGTQRQDKNLINAALVISNFLTGKYELPKQSVPKAVDQRLEEERQQFEQEKQEFYGKQVNGFFDGADKITENELNKLLRNGLDPDNSMSTFLKNAIVRSTIEEVKDYVTRDQAFQGHMRDLFNRAKSEGLSHQSRSRLVSAYLGRVKDIALKIRASKRAEALKRSSDEIAPENKTPTYRQPVKKAPSSATSSKKLSELDIIRAR